ncbi:matrixin family metalloprotease [Candidatus Obscuribacterales bacterium]|jgi:hypothetical protein|nr:matrixin family metalloprotease [Candidatus Obscuribacterales bacterium]
MLALCGAVTLVVPAGSQETAEEASLDSVVQSLEEDAGLVATPADPITKRLSGLELKVFGSIQPGALIDRINKIRLKLDADKAKQPQDAHPEPGEAPVAPEDPVKKKIFDLNRTLPMVNASMPLFFRVEPTEPVTDRDYLNDILDATQKKVMRFKSMPIPVYITPYQIRSYTRACVEGFESWEHRTNGLVRFVQVASPNQARIRVTWKRLGMSTDTDNCALGAHTVTKWQKNAGGKMTLVGFGSIPLPVYIPRMGPKYTVPAQVIEVNVDLIDQKVQDYRFTLLKNIVTHELGHALGLLGHSGEKSDMMYTVTDENSRISDRDINTLEKLYGMKIDIPL